MVKMIVSIVIPTLNEEKNIGNILGDISKQDFSKEYIEVLVTDAGSNDNTRNIALQHGAKLIQGGLPSVARNQGAKNAKGQTVYFMDSDIRLKQGFITDSFMEFKMRSLDIAGMDNLPIFDDNDKLYDRSIITAVNSLANILIRASEKTSRPKAIGTCMIFNRKSLLDAGGFDEKIYWGEDTEIAQRMARLEYNFGILRNSCIYTRPRKVLAHGVLRYYINAVRLNNYRENDGEICSKEKYQEITGISDYFKIKH